MIKGFKVYTSTPVSYKTDEVAKLQHLLVQSSFFNLLVVAVAGALLRAYPFLDTLPFTYKNLLHGHSHFAFGGWVMPILLALIMKLFPELVRKADFAQWRNLTLLMLASAYGMLLSFPVQGYGVVSIIFSTLSVLAGYYLVYLLWQALKHVPSKTSYLFLKAGLFYLAISAIGPFATGPLIAMGKSGSPLYHNSIYFYLHFQYNGWFLFAVLALLYKQLEAREKGGHGKTVFWLMNGACIPAFALSLLWNKPSLIYNFIGGAAALLQLVALFYLWKDVRQFKASHQWLQHLLKAAFVAFVLKVILQVASAFPAIASMAYQNRNFVIAYLHLVLLGVITVFAMASTFQHYYIRRSINIRTGLAFFFVAFIVTELLIAGAAAGNLWGFSIPFYTEQLLFFSFFLPAGLFLIFYDMSQQLRVLMYLD